MKKTGIDKNLEQKKYEYEMQVKMTKTDKQKKEIVDKYEKMFGNDKRYGIIQGHKILNNKVIMSDKGQQEFKIMVESGYDEKIQELRSENK